jgi:antitoxin CcdA
MEIPLRTKSVGQRKGVNLSISQSLLNEAKALDVNLSRAAERGVALVISETKAKAWRQENAAAIMAYNELVEREGLPLADYRDF